MKTQKSLPLLRTRTGKVAGLSTLVAAALVLVVCLKSAGRAELTDTSGGIEQAMKAVNGTVIQLSPATLADLGTTQAEVKDFPETLDVQGSIGVVENLVTVVPCRVGQNAPSRVDEVLKVTGDTVHAGEPLALLYSPDYVSAKEEYLQVAGKNGYSRDSMADASQSGDLSGFATEARDKLLMMGLRPRDIANLPRETDNHLVVRAIRDGAIISVNTMVGNLQNLGDTLFTTASLDKVWFEGDLYIEDLPKVHKGQKIIINAEGLDKPLTGTISFISPVLDANVRTVKVRAIIGNPGHLLRPSMFVEGDLVLNDKPALLVPEDAVLKLNDKAYCFKAIGNGRFQEVPVTISREDGMVAGISAGLSKGDQIVASDLDTLDHVLDDSRPN
jgi:membrane fusion protein, copper/silver efflux system